MSRRGWDTFKKNLDIYLTIILSVIVSFLDLAGIVDEKAINTSILWVLAAIAVSLLRERWLREEMISKLLFPERTWPDLEGEMAIRLRQASKVKFVGVGPLGIVRRHKDELERILRRERGKVFFIVVDPESEAMKLVMQGRPENYNDGVLFLEEICKLFGAFIESGRLQIKLINYIPSNIMALIDDDQENGIIFATQYSFNQVDPYRPSRLIARRERLWYSFFQREFESLWSAGKYYKCSGSDMS
jgi:hypothetical protein